jgi:uncharacterized membrane protein YjgN (DUF898 family)
MVRAGHNSMNWYYAVGGQRHGPFRPDEFIRIVGTGVITETTLVWREGLAEWRPFAEVKAELGPLPPAVPGQPPAAPAEPVGFEFTGKAGEYFKIWIVNLLLTIVTLGIYAAWAKVRNRRYFYANTRLLGHAFDYTGDPVRILIGNLIVLGMAVVYFTSGAVSPLLVVLVLLLFMAVTPWLIVKSLSFNARNSAYRGLRFGFDGKYGGAALNYLLLPVAAVFTLYLLFPWVQREQKKFTVGHHRYGATRFHFHGSTEGIYKIFGLTLLFFLPLLIAYGGIIGLMIAQGPRTPGAPPPAMIGVWGLLFFPAMISALIGSYFYRARVFNYVWGGTTLGGHRFEANMSFPGLLGLQIVNALAVTFTLGLLYPWAKVRLVEFMLKSLRFVPAGSIDDLAGAGPAADESAVGESAADFFDFDIGLGL